MKTYFYVIFIAILFSGCASKENINGKLYAPNGETFDKYVLVSNMKLADNMEDLGKGLILFSGEHNIFEVTFDLYWVQTCKNTIEQDYKIVMDGNFSHNDFKRWENLKKTDFEKYQKYIKELHQIKCNF